MNYKRRILVIRLSALGDVAILEPVLKERASISKDVLFLMAGPPLLQPLFQGVDNIQFVPTEKSQPVRQLYDYLASQRPDIVADMHHVNRVVGVDWLFRMHGVPVFAIHKRLPRGKPMWERYNDVLDRCGLPPASDLPILASTYWKPGLLQHSPLVVGVAPFAQHQGKIWPAHLMEQLLLMLSKDGRFRTVLLGGAADAPLLEDWAGRYANTVSIAGKYGFEEDLKQISNMDLVVSMDSANMHFASCLGVPVVSVWGATHPCRGFYGWRQDPQWAVQSEMRCRPCSKYGSRPCRKGNYPCLASITPQMVYDKILVTLTGEFALRQG